MKVSIEKGKHNTVSVQGDYQGPYVALDLSPEAAYSLLQELEKHRDEIQDLATNYYECDECGESHLKTLQKCPNIG